MSLHDNVRIGRRFQRSIKIESDLGSPHALDGYVCPGSAAQVLSTMVRHIQSTGQAAFTWTGPYGTGKSSLALALCAALSGKEKLRHAGEHALGKSLTHTLGKAFPTRGKSWRVVAMTGRRVPLATLLGDAFTAAGLIQGKPARWSDERILAQLSEISRAGSCSGLLIVVDELGKVLEGAAHDGHDIFLLQQIAELTSRSNGRLIFIGILHQSFDEYAHRLAREARDEWAKVQGRFVDLIINATGDEQIDLLARAIESGRRPSDFAGMTKAVAALVSAGRPGASAALPDMLTRCWPLHPVTACLLGPVSRRRFGQNQRSLFGFLNSAEPFGLQDFLTEATDEALYTPDMLWDYLRANLEPAILASPDGHRWSIAADAIERCKAADVPLVEIALLKTIALIELFRERSGLSASKELLALCALCGTNKHDVAKALQDLQQRSLVLYRKHLSAFALFAGSDFDIESAIAGALPKADTLDLRKLHALAGLQPILAKRHYHETGAMRWFHIDLLALNALPTVLAEPENLRGAAGRFLLVLPTEGESVQKASALCQSLAEDARPNLVIGLSRRAWDLLDVARELVALTAIAEGNSVLRGDAVARREVMARLSDCRTRLEQLFGRICDDASWYRAGEKPVRLGSAGLNTLASQIADEQYPEAPRILNELLGRILPSSSAVKAQRDLMRRMILGQGEHRLGIVGYPAEGGLCDSILTSTRLYRQDKTGTWRFMQPDPRKDEAHIAPLWKAALDFLAKNAERAVALSSVFDLWRAPPFGVKNGLMPVLAVALYLAHRDKLAVYRQGVFQPQLSDIDIEMLASDPRSVHLRWMKLSATSETVLRELSDLAHTGNCGAVPEGPFETARALISVYDELQPFTKRSMRLPPETRRLNALLKNAADPNKLLFNDLPALAADGPSNPTPKEIAGLVRSGLETLKKHYPATLKSLAAGLLRELDVANDKPESLALLRERAEHLQQLSGDFRANAFVARLSEYRGRPADIEGLASLAINKRPQDWVDSDIDDARLSLAKLAQRFIVDEAFAHVDNRPDKRMRLAVVVPLHGQPRTMQREFDVTDQDREEISELIHKVEEALSRADPHRKNVILAALAELSARYMQDAPQAKKKGRAGA